VRRERGAGEAEPLHFVVADAGGGMAADKQSAIFANFEQGGASMARRFGGTGLGLAIASKLVGLMNGKIRVEKSLAGRRLGREGWRECLPLHGVFRARNPRRSPARNGGCHGGTAVADSFGGR
jgi:signal transduction histidine kinase